MYTHVHHIFIHYLHTFILGHIWLSLGTTLAQYLGLSLGSLHGKHALQPVTSLTPYKFEIKVKFKVYKGFLFSELTAFFH